MIRFLQPWWLLVLLPVLAVAGAYVWRQLHRQSYAIRFTNVDLLRTLAPKGLGWRRHVPAPRLPAQPDGAGHGDWHGRRWTPEEPLERATVMLAIDVSLSMQADDVAPTRLEAAQEAAKQFVAELPRELQPRAGLVRQVGERAGAADKGSVAVTQAIDGLVLAEATATGEAVFTCLEAIRMVPADGAAGIPPARIVLLSDGYRTSGRSVEEAGAAAQAANVPVSTIAFGTDDGKVESAARCSGCRSTGRRSPQLAETTEGYFYEAASVSELKQVYQDMGSSIGFRTEPREITQWYAGDRVAARALRAAA